MSISPRTVSSLLLPNQSVSIKSLQAFHHFRAIPLVEYINVEPEILIGLVNYQLLSAQSTVVGAWNKLVGVKRRLGCPIYGNISNSFAICEATVIARQVSNDCAKSWFRIYSYWKALA